MARRLTRKASPDPEPKPDDGTSVVSSILGEIDAEQERQRAVDAAAFAPKDAPVVFKGGARAVTSAKPMPVEGEEQMQVETEVYDRNYNRVPETFAEWSSRARDKYTMLMSVRATEDFIDHDRLNAVMADYASILSECIREAKLLKNEAEDARRHFTSWWATMLIKAETHAARKNPPKKLTSQTAVESYARGLYGDEREAKEVDVFLAERKAEFIGSFKDMIRNMPSVLTSLARSIQFEWSTSGGIKVQEDDEQFRLSPARGNQGHPDPEALTRVLRTRNLDNTENR